MVEETKQVEEQEAEVQQEQIEAKPKRKPIERLFRIFSIFGGVVALIALGVVKYLVPTFSWVWVGIIVGGIVLIALTLFFAFDIYRRFRDRKLQDLPKPSKELPPAITVAQAWEIAEQALKSPLYSDYMQKPPKDFGVEEHGELSQKIFFLSCTGKYTPNNTYFIALNMHYPETNRRILIDPTAAQISQVKRRLAVGPDKDPDVQTIKTENLFTGTRQVVRRRSTAPKPIPQVPEKREDLV